MPKLEKNRRIVWRVEDEALSNGGTLTIMMRGVVIHLNETAAKIFLLCNGERNSDEVIMDMGKYFEGYVGLDEDIRCLINELLKERIIYEVE